MDVDLAIVAMMACVIASSSSSSAVVTEVIRRVQATRPRHLLHGGRKVYTIIGRRKVKSELWATRSLTTVVRKSR